MDALPPEVRTELVMSAAALDGQGVTTRRFRSAEPPESLLSSVRERWRGEGHAVVESRAGEWLLISMRDAQGFTTVQARARAAGSEGMVSRWRSAASGPATSTPAQGAPLERWLPAGFRVLRRIGHDDPGRRAATLVAWAPSPPQGLGRTLRDAAARDGFVDDPALGAPANGAAWYRGGDASGEAFALRRGRDEVVGTLSSHRDGTAVVLHWGSPR